MGVYLVTDGEYSDYRVVGVYSSIELAERGKELHNSSNNIEYKEIDPDFSHIPDGYLCFQVWGLIDELKVNQQSVDWFKFEGNWQYDDYNGFTIDVVARDKDHAIKIASKKINILKATHNIDWSDAEAAKKLQKDLPTI